MKRRQLKSGIPTFDVVRAIDILREINIKTDTMVTAAELHFERFSWVGEGEDEDEDLKQEHMAHLLGTAKEAARAAVIAGSQISAMLAKHRTGS